VIFFVRKFEDTLITANPCFYQGRTIFFVLFFTGKNLSFALKAKIKALV